MLVPHLLKIYFGLGWPSSVLKIVSVTNIKTKTKNGLWVRCLDTLQKKYDFLLIIILNADR